MLQLLFAVGNSRFFDVDEWHEKEAIFAVEQELARAKAEPTEQRQVVRRLRQEHCRCWHCKPDRRAAVTAGVESATPAAISSESEAG